MKNEGLKDGLCAKLENGIVGGYDHTDFSSERLINVRSVAEILVCSERTVWRLVDGGKMPAPIRIGRLVRWSSEAIKNWIDDGCPVTRTFSA